MSQKKVQRKNKPEIVTVQQPDFYTREMDRIFQDFERRFARPFYVQPFENLWGPGARWWQQRQSLWDLPDARRAFTDLIDTGGGYKVRAEVPGIPKEKINISVMPKEIKIEGEAETNIDETKEGFVHRERAYSSIRKDLPFPEEVIPEKADAIVKDGILEVTIPKKNPTEIKKHKVQVK